MSNLNTLSLSRSDLERAAAAAIQDQARRELQKRNKARGKIIDFTRYTFPDYYINWHHALIGKYLDLWAAKQIGRLMLFMPPRHGKSELVSRRLPAKILGDNPDARLITTSYSADLAQLMNRDVQRIIDSPEYATLYPNTRLWGKNVRAQAHGTYLRNSDVFEVVDHQGMYRSAGVGGGIGGIGFDFGIIDDPIKNRTDANSPTIRQSVWNWYTSTFYTRQEKDAAILLTVTRWHMDDIAGRLLEQMASEDGEEWVILEFPAIAEEPLHPEDIRKLGEPLWPWKYPLPKLQRIMRTIGLYDWASLYQQKPVLGTGGLFKRDKLHEIPDPPSDIVRRVRYWDLATSAKTSADYTVGVLMGLTSDGHIVILDVKRKQIDWDEVEGFIAKTIVEDGKAVIQGIEKAFMLTRAYKKLAARPDLLPYTINGYQPETDKVTRALPFAARVGADMVHVVRRHWTNDFINELAAFDKAPHDDQVDAASGAYNMLAESSDTIYVGTQKTA